VILTDSQPIFLSAKLVDKMLKKIFNKSEVLNLDIYPLTTSY